MIPPDRIASDLDVTHRGATVAALALSVVRVVDTDEQAIPAEHFEDDLIVRFEGPGTRVGHVVGDPSGRSATRLIDKARSYAKALPKTSLRFVKPVILFAVPSTARADKATQALDRIAAPTSIVVWTSARSSLTLATAERALNWLRGP